VFRELVYLINVDKVPQEIRVGAFIGKAFKLHPIQAGSTAADQRVTKEARFDSTSGSFRVPARSVSVFVVN
jgi:hypothetical protein